MAGYVPASQTPTSSSAGGFAGSQATDATLGITRNQGSQPVTITPVSATGGAYDPNGYSERTGGAGHGAQTMTVSDILNQFNTMDPSTMSTIGQELWNAGLMSDGVYNSGQMSTTDIYNAYKKAVLGAASTGTALPDFLDRHVSDFQASGGPKVKLPSARYTNPLTSYDDVALAVDTVFQKYLGRRGTDAEKQAVTATLNNLETSGKTAEAQSAYSQMLAYRGLNADGSPAGTTPFGTGVTDAQGGQSTVTQGPIITSYHAPPSSDALAAQTAMQNNGAEVKGRTIAGAMQAIAQFVGQK